MSPKRHAPPPAEEYDAFDRVTSHTWVLDDSSSDDVDRWYCAECGETRSIFTEHDR